jgi:hypothetical protein
MLVRGLMVHISDNLREPVAYRSGQGFLDTQMGDAFRPMFPFVDVGFRSSWAPCSKHGMNNDAKSLVSKVENAVNTSNRCCLPF